jgi:regulator of sigma E protease
MTHFLTFLIYPAATALVLGVLVFIHELGHYAVAKWCGVRVETFSIGFGKRLFGFRRGDTDYRISLIPLGGYVKMAGENPMEDRTGDPGEFTSHPRWQRFLIAIAGPVMNILLAVSVLTLVYKYHHEYEAFRKLPVDVFFFSSDSPAEKAGIRLGDRITRIENIQNPTWEQAIVSFALNPKQPVDVTVQRGNQVLNMKVVPNETSVDHVGDAGIRPPEVIGTLTLGAPAEKAGLHQGDALLAVNDKSVRETGEILDILQQTKDAPVQLTVWRDGKEMRFTAQPQVTDPGGDQGKKYRLGFVIMAVERLPFPLAFRTACQDSKDNAFLIFKMLAKLIENKNSIKQMSGPVGIAKLSGDAAREGFSSLMLAMAFISLNLAIFNLLPIPILDGGLMLTLLIESILRRDINQKVKERAYQVAFVCLILFASVVIFNDVAKGFHH